MLVCVCVGGCAVCGCGCILCACLGFKSQVSAFIQASGISWEWDVGWLPYGFYFLKLYGFSGITCAFCVFSVQSSQTSVQFSFGILIK